MKFLKLLLIFVFAVFLVSVLYFKASLAGWIIDKSTPAEIAAIIEPNITVYKPEGADPFPTVLMFHGCAGDKEQQAYWAKEFQSWGYAAVLVDSYKGRGITRETASSRVCKGFQLIGGERAGDVLTALAWTKQQSWADFNKLTLAGWSHGAWSIMDAFALSADDKLPHNLISAPDADLADVDNLVLFYPYCGVADQGSETGWHYTPSTLAITAEHDSVVGDNVCDASLSAIESNAPRFRHKVLLGVDHAFDNTVAIKDFAWEGVTPMAAAIAATDESKRLIRTFLE